MSKFFVGHGPYGILCFHPPRLCLTVLHDRGVLCRLSGKDACWHAGCGRLCGAGHPAGQCHGTPDAGGQRSARRGCGAPAHHQSGGSGPPPDATPTAPAAAQASTSAASGGQPATAASSGSLANPTKTMVKTASYICSWPVSAMGRGGLITGYAASRTTYHAQHHGRPPGLSAALQ